MSTIRVDNFGPSAGGTTYSARGIAKAWVNFDGTGTIAARDSENVSSLTDNGTGQYSINLSNAFGAVDYTVSGVTGNDDTANSGLRTLNAYIPSSTSSSIRVHTSAVSSTTNRVNSDELYAFTIAHGDLA
jgi:hypothetical protein